MISVIILTKNSSYSIKKTLDSVKDFDEIVIVDDYSDDETLRITKNLEPRIKNIHIYKRRLGNNFAAQRNFGLEKAKGEWVFFLDSDEVLDMELREEIKKISQKDASAQFYDAYRIKRKDFFMGKWLRFGETGNISFIRLGKKDAGRWQGRVHEEWIVRGKIGKLNGRILHYPHKNIFDFLGKINTYSELVAQHRFEKGVDVSVFSIIFYPLGKFILNYFFRLGFLDGVHGIIMALMMSFHSFLVRSKLYLKNASKYN